MIFVIGATLPLIDVWRWWRWRSSQPKGDYPERTDWSAFYGGGIHLSGYVFRDRNRNGVFDVGDLPMASVVVTVTTPAGKTLTERSNVAGFANFQMSRSERDAVLRMPGEYVFGVRVPPGWILTTGNASQRTTLEELPGAPADLVSKNPPRPFGLAPRLVIGGRVGVRGVGGTVEPPSGVSLSARGPGGEVVDVPLSPGGSFEISAAPGRWTLIARKAGSDAGAERELVVRDAPVRVSTIVLGDPKIEPAGRRTTVDFESITGTPVMKVPSGVAGLDWFYLNAIDAVTGGDAYVNNLTSGRYVGYGSSGHPVTISRPGGFDFFGAYFGVGSRDAEGETLRIQAFRGDTAAAEDELRLSSLGPVWFDASFHGIDRLVLTTRNYWQLVVDDMEVGVPSGHPEK
ncbi:MAG: hypothetical protein ACHQPI_11920 [Thermoanaerobaculia bacterium]